MDCEKREEDLRELRYQHSVTEQSYQNRIDRLRRLVKALAELTRAIDGIHPDDI